MTIQERILLDKWLECVYHLDKMKIKWLEIQNEGAKKIEASREFKFEFNSFVNSSRSVTFVMQKCFKNKVEGFEDWYNEVQDELKKNKFAKILVEIRNTNQKEGNKYPDIIEVRTINEYFQSEITFSPFPPQENKLFTSLNLTEEQKKSLPSNITDFNLIPIIENFDIDLIYDNKPEETYDEVKLNMEKMLIQETLKQVSSKLFQITKDELKNARILTYKLKIDQETYTWEEFYEECNKILQFYKNKSLECVKLFT